MNGSAVLLDVDTSTLSGHFLGPLDAARAAGVSPADLAAMRGVIVIAARDGSRPTYPSFQFVPEGGFIPGLREAVALIGDAIQGPTLAGWVLAPQPKLGGASIVAWLKEGRSATAVEDLIASTLG